MKQSSIATVRSIHQVPPFRLAPIRAVVIGAALSLAAQGAMAQVQPALEAGAAAAATAAADASANPNAGTNANTAVLEELVINGGKAKVNVLTLVKEVPVSISIVSGEELDKQGALNVNDIFKRIGNVQWNYGNPKTGSMAIRGVSAGSSEAIEPSLGINVDGVPYAYVALASGADYVDLDNVNVTRGPQGSTGGKNTSMGTINIQTRAPSFNPEANASLTLGQNNSVIAQAAAGGSVVDGLVAWRGTFYRNQQEGFYKNQYGDIEDRTSYENVDRTYGRVQFLVTPSENFSARLSVDYKPKGIEYVNGATVRNTTPATYADGTPYAYVANRDPLVVLSRTYFTSRGYGYQDYINKPIDEDQNKGILNGSKGASADLNWTLPGGYNLQSISSFRNNFFQASNDEGTPFDITKNAGLFVHYKQTSQEFRLTSPADPTRFFDFTTGFIFFHNDSDASSRTRYGSDAGAWFASNAQYYGVAASNTALVPAAVPGGLIYDAPGQLLLRDSLDRIFTRTVTFTDNNSLAGYGQIEWHLSDKWTLTTGLRLTREDRETAQVKETTDDGVGVALNPVAQGGFNTDANGALVGTQTADQQAKADLVAQTYFGVPTYAALNATQRGQVAKAKALRASQGYSALYGYTDAEPFNGTLKTGNVSLSYKVNDDLTTYATWQHGAKAGISQISGQLTAPTTTTAGAGKSALTLPEESNTFELGLRSALLDRSLIVNADIFLDRLKNYQQAVQIYDAAQAIATPANPYVSVTGNVGLVEIKGLELDASYNGIQNFTFRLAAAYNDARYESHTRLANPVEDGDLALKSFDAYGLTLPKAPKFTSNLSVEYRRPILEGNHEFHTSVNYNYRTSFKADASLSDYSTVNGYGLTDFGIGFGRTDKLFDVNLLVKNLFDTEYRNNQTWNSYIPATNRRWVGFVFSAKL
ncbi:MAG TPA: TonB-dependent receptor [Candidatus Acidoferrum sp.]|nr:TonB-dependent receptor [Candidatus Acidoferrum sp.]